MKSRFIASLALGAAVVLGATGCNMLAPQATTIEYSASDGRNVPESGPLKVRNAMIIANEDGSLGNLIGGVVNSTDEDLVLNVGIGSDLQTLPVPARSSVSIGVTSAPMLFENLGAAPGSDVEVSFQSGDGEGTAVAIPILDGTLPYYTEFVPTPLATPGD
ncbi:DNA modification methylase [Microbacterium dauci]|uniref:DNA modification methylase n=1 Tax=Microbacterium dauci TaxID=3048008 RepID=A0ABT6ZFM7_9MICO|nr:DNA modification methylase [Microbacterium sp. LX3-4]MDJ1114972.1 DNA modification methylase [Microbacterium sp. LX3-4]